MKRLSLILLLTAVTIPNAVFAQRWSAEQQEVLDHIRACWEAGNTRIYDNWVAVCKPVENRLWWNTSEGLPGNNEHGRAATEAGWKTNNRETLWRDSRPLDVQIHGDVALVYFYALFGWTGDGGIHTTEQKRLEVFRKVDGQWTTIGGMVVPSE